MRNSKHKTSQCRSCEQLGHSKINCFFKSFRIKCDEPDKSKKLSNPQKAPPQCVNCGGFHPTNVLEYSRNLSGSQIKTLAKNIPHQQMLTYFANEVANNCPHKFLRHEILSPSNHTLTDNIHNLYFPNYPQLSRRNQFPRPSAMILQDSKIHDYSSILAYLKTCPADNHISGTFSRSGVAVFLSISKN